MRRISVHRRNLADPTAVMRFQVRAFDCLEFLGGGGSATGAAASASTGSGTLPPFVVPRGSGPGQPTLKVIRRSALL